MNRIRRVFQAIGPDATTAVLILLAAAIGCWAYMNTGGVVTGAMDNVSNMLRPAVYLAKGYGFADCDPLPPAVDDFLNDKRPSLDEAIPADPRIHSARDTFYQDRYYLIYAVGLVWRVFGVSWENLRILSALFFGMTAAILYGIFRLGMRRSTSLAGVSLSMMSPVMLMETPSIRDFTKAPFILASIFLCGYLLVRPVSRARFFTTAMAMGLAIGVGLGFRQDAIVCLPLALLFLACFARGTSRLSFATRIAAIALVFVTLIPAAWPALSMTAESGGNNAFYLTQGFSEPCLRNLDMNRASYTPLNSQADYFVEAYIYTFAQEQLAYYKALPGLRMLAGAAALAETQVMPATPAPLALPQAFSAMNDNLNGWTPAGEKVARRYVYELATTLPADVIARWYAATLRVIRHLHPIADTGGRSNPMLAGAWACEQPVALHLYRYGLIYTAAAALLMAGCRFRLALGAFLILVYSCGYPSLEFLCRHTFHLNFVSLWIPCFLIDKVITTAVPAGRKVLFTTPRPRLSAAPLLRMACFAACMALLLCVPLQLARAYQGQRVARIEEQYRRADLEPLPITEATDSNGRVSYSSSRFPAFDGIPPVGLWNVLSLTGLPVKRVPDMLAEYVVAEVEATGVNADIRLQYGDAPVCYVMEDRYPLPSGSPPRTFRIFFPVFRFTDNFVQHYEAPVASFSGISFGDGVQLKGLYRVRNKEAFPLLMHVWLPSGAVPFEKCQRVKWVTM